MVVDNSLFTDGARLHKARGKMLIHKGRILKGNLDRNAVHSLSIKSTDYEQYSPLI